MGSQVVAAFIAFWTFWVLLPYGYAVGELSPKQIGVFLLLWIGGRLGLAYLPWMPAAGLFSPYAPFWTSLLFSRFLKAMFGCPNSGSSTIAYSKSRRQSRFEKSVATPASAAPSTENYLNAATPRPGAATPA